MAMIVKLVGIEARDYPDKKTGEMKHYCGLHVVHAQKGNGRNWSGYRVEQLTCPRDVDDRTLKLNAFYELEYQIQQTRSGTYARLVDLVEVGPDDVQDLIS